MADGIFYIQRIAATCPHAGHVRLVFRGATAISQPLFHANL
jgi:hypothetical protein